MASTRRPARLFLRSTA